MSRLSDKSAEDQLSPADQDLIGRFEAAYNGIDRALKDHLGVTEYVPFRTLLEDYNKLHPHWKDDKEDLIEFSRLRNVVVHNRVYPYRYYAIPTASAVRGIEAIYARLTQPARAIPTWQREVRVVQISDSLPDVLSLINTLEHSRFPVYENGTFCGLLTENSITRWLARHSARNSTRINLHDHRVREVMSEARNRPNWEFVPADATVDEVRYKFARNPRLEAALITPHGQLHEALSGIVTRGDMLPAPTRDNAG